MKSAKKFISFISAALIAVSAAIPFGAVAESSDYGCEWWKHDPNMDGRLEIADATLMLQCLGGHYQPVDMWQMDITENGIVSYADVYLIMLLDAKGELPRYVEH